jgi:nucleotide-binding universal stress UspA family protein
VKVLLAVDASTPSEDAIQAVAGRPWPPHTTMEVISVVEPSYVWNVPSLVDGLRQIAEEQIQAIANRLRASGCAVTTRMLFGDPKAVIVDRAAETRADLIVVGSHGTDGLRQLLLGSVANAVIRFASCSVEIVRASAHDGTGDRVFRILLATDGSEYSEVAARSVADRPWPAGCEIRVFSVVELHVPLFQAPYPPYLNPHAMEDLRGEAMRRAEQALMAAEQIVVDAGLPESSTVAVPVATPQELILKEAADWGADLIVLGSHGRRGFSRFLLGSVSEAVASHAPCSVEVIRQARKAA